LIAAKTRQSCVPPAIFLSSMAGALIELRLTSTRQALNVLVHSATSKGGLYDQAGLAVAAHKGKPLTAA
jgi:flagella synthesis protein FlgN